MEKIILDTNFLLAIPQFKVDIFDEIDRIIVSKYTIYVLDQTVAELEKLINKSRLSHKRAAKFALSVVKRKGLAIIKTKQDKCADDLLVELDNKHIIATQDQELKRRLKEKGFRILTIRQKKYLIMD